MARKGSRNPQGVDGDWFIDDRCIGCGASTSITPGLIVADDTGSKFVFARQPASADEVVLAQQAPEVCPTKSIGTESGTRWRRHHPVEVSIGVWRLGSNSPVTAGGNAFLVQRRGGNLLIDGPRWTKYLSDRIEELGGIDHVLLRHRDDVGDAGEYARAFGADVLIHEDDQQAAPAADRILTGGDPVELADGVVAIPTPVHTIGHVMFLLDDDTLFSGDSLSWDPHRGSLWAEKFVCWHSWPDQLDSLEGFSHHPFRRVIPTHGAISPELTSDEMAGRLRELLVELRSAA